MIVVHAGSFFASNGESTINSGWPATDTKTF
jgi:hypothetical protein